MKSIFRFFVQNHLIANLLTVMIFLLGLNTLLNIKRDSYPNVDYGYMNISTNYPGASPEDVEINVTNKIEKELKSVTGIKNFTSISMENTSFIRVVIDPDVRDQQKVQRDVREAVNRVIDLPEEVVDAPLIEEVNTSLTPILEVGITGRGSYKRMRNYAREFEKKLRALPEVSRLSRYGYQAREIHIEVSPQKISDYQISLGEIINAIQRRNIRSTAGTFESFTTEHNVVTLAEFRNPMDVRDVIVRATYDGPTVKIKDLAIVKDDFEKASVLSRINGERAISFMVMKKESADVIDTADAVKKLVAESSKNIPEGLKLSVATDYSHYVKNQFKVVLTNAFLGLTMVLILLTVFLNGRAAFWIAIGIPVALLGTVFLMPKFDSYLNSLTLGAMIMVIGIIVDDAIIIGENIFKHRQMGKSAVDAAVDGVTEVFWPVVTTIMTTFCAFAPMFFIPGIFGKFIKSMPLIITLALCISMFEMIIALPAHLLPSLKRKHISYERNWFKVWQIRFAKLLRKCLPFRRQIVLGFCFVFAMLIWVAVTHMKFVLLPSKMAQEIYIITELPNGIPLSVTADKIKDIEAIVESLPENEVASYVTKIGEEWLDEIKMENHANITISLTPYGKRKRTPQQIVDELRTKTDEVGDYVNLFYFIETGGPPVGKAINLYIVGPDDTKRKELTDAVFALLNQTDGVKDIERKDKLGKKQIDLQPDYERLARLGLSVADIARNARIAVDGEIVTSVRYNNEDVDFRVINDRESRFRKDYLSNMLIPNKDNRLIKLSNVVNFTETPGYALFQHYDGERAVAIYADVDKDIIAPMNVMKKINEAFNLDRDWPGMRIIKSGEIYETEQSLTALMRAFCIAVIAIYFLLIMLFKSFRQPLVVIFAIPFGVMGVILAFALHGEPLSFLGMLGTIALAGVVVNDSLVLVNHINHLVKQNPNSDIFNLVIDGTTDRLRAIVMTTLTTVAGLLPLAYGWGGADPFVAPMALALGFGLFFATPLILIIIPSLYLINHELFLHRDLPKSASKEFEFNINVPS